MNFKVRANNIAFWANVVMAVVAPVLAYFGLTLADLTTWAKVWEVTVQAVSNPYVLILAGVGIWNALIDPTTVGWGDSERAMGYEKPYKDGVDK